jgi:hypothetical protein
MNHADLARRRLTSTLLEPERDPRCDSERGRRPPSPADVVDHLVAVQSQEFGLARWSVGQRSGADDAMVISLLDAGELLRTHVLRPTWHYVRPADLRWLQQLTGPRVQVLLRSWMGRLGLDEPTRARFCELMSEALAGGRSLTRDQIAAIVAEAGIEVDRMGLTHLLIHAELESVICSGPVAVPAGAGSQAVGRHHTYALVDARVPAARPRSRQEALADLTVRYFVGHGPATVKDFAWWSSLTLADIRRGLAEVRDGLESAEIDGRTYWGPPGWTDRSAAPAGVHLLQAFDEFVVGYGDSRGALDVAGIANMIGPTWGRDGHPVVVDGQVVGHWRRRVGAGELEMLAIAPRRDLTGTEAGLVLEAAGGLAAFLGHSGQIELCQPGGGSAGGETG